MAELAAQAAAAEFQLPVIDENRVQAAGIKRLAGKHLTLYHDLPDAAAAAELVTVFDAAVPLWGEYFSIPAERWAEWRVIGCAMQAQERYGGAGLYPGDLPNFPHGFTRGSQVWIYEQKEAFYRRHLLLHEGTHAFMYRWLGGAGPPWYMEGMAELLGTHRWEGGRLRLGYNPRSKEEAPDWGRVRIVKDEFAAGRGMQLPEIFRLDAHAHLRNEPYGWCWAAATFFAQHPRWQGAFRALQKETHDRSLDFSERFTARLKDDWPQVATDWQLFVVQMDYGYDVARSAVVYQPAAPLPAGGGAATVQADRGWQSSGLMLTAGKRYRVTASGRYLLAQGPDWPCEPGGVTLRYHRGYPLGMLLGAVAGEDDSLRGVTGLAQPQPIGLSNQITPAHDGVLFLAINEASAGLADNQGRLTVQVAAE